ncbi:hypothetical protein LOTGIDRAFT_159640 [Lottia gigantea]|uniref:G-protein coupled receptors family 2 profile 2 domain-containing protein n=1 Tax=Lottia gigantea TaxID=225164 RepID=V4AT55_LOTGI|nr:hypothetical protein LOTGIDRAFT_159640 [Lottia gigantea]ESO96891.1 hypothetical protein LOTGIDRAFT_159640 [Lottia gigantea]
MCVFIWALILSIQTVAGLLELNIQETIIPYELSGPFDFVIGEYEDFESKAMDIEAQYCSSSCSERFKNLNANEPNSRCAPCFCDSDCYKYNDCCPDKILFEKPETEIQPDTKYGCHGTIIRNRYYQEFYQMIDKCPESFTNQEIKENCHKSDSIHWKYVKPYFDFKTKETYRNKYCALCNNVMNSKSYETQITCQTFDDYGNSTNSTEVYYHVISNYKCQVRFNPPTTQSIDRRQCDTVYQPFYSKCNKTGLWKFYDERVERACELYTNIVNGEYRNVFCRLCNEVIFWLSFNNEANSEVVIAAHGMTSLLNLGDQNDYQMVKATRLLATPSKPTIACSDDEILNPLSCGCEKLFCTGSKTLKNGRCQSVFLESNSFGYDMCVRVAGTINTTAPEPFLAFGFVLPNYDSPYYLVDRYATPVKVEDCGNGFIQIAAEVKTQIIFMDLVPTDVTELDLVNKMKQVGEEVNSYYDGDMTSTLERACPPPLNLVLPEYVVPNSLCIGKPSNFFESFAPIIPEVKKALKFIEFIPLSKLLTCTLILVNSSQVTHEPRILTLLHNNVTLSSGEFEIQDDQFVVCTEDFLFGTSIDECSPTDVHQNTTNGTRDGNISATPLGILSVVCTCISLLFLIITFVFYCIVKDLRNVVGVNVMGLIINLFIAQLVYEFGLELFDYPVLCKAMGISNHYFWLSATFWMNCCTIVLFMKLSFPLHSRAFTTKYILLRSSLYSTITPLVIVVITIVVNMSNNGTIGYGNRAKCYMSYANDRRYAFALPLGLLIITNVGLFSYTFIKIRVDQVESTINKENKINILACLKLSVITGVAWIFAFIYEATGAIVFAYLFTILVGTQGVVIFLAFVANKRVCMSCKDKVHGTPDSSSSGISKKMKYLSESIGISTIPSPSKSKSSTDSDREYSMKVGKNAPKVDENTVQ